MGVKKKGGTGGVGGILILKIVYSSPSIKFKIENKCVIF